MSGRYDRFTTAEGTPLSRTLTFPAQTVIIDNISASWAYSTDGGRSIPPWTYGVTLPVSGTTQAALSWNTPAGIPSPTPSGGTATLIYTDDVLALSNGQQVVTPSQQLALPISTVIGSTGGSIATQGKTSFRVSGTGQVTVDYVIPQGTNSLIITGNETGAGGEELYVFSVKGLATNTFYAGGSAGQVTATLPYAFVVAPASDPTVQLIIESEATLASLSTIEVVASFGTQAVDISGQPIMITNATSPAGATTPLEVHITQPLGGNPYIISASYASGASTTLAPAGTLKAGIYGGSLSVDAVATTAVGVLRDSSAIVTYWVGSFQENALIAIPAYLVGAGDGGLVFVNGGSATASFRGSISAA